MVPWARPLIWSVFRNEAYCHCVDQRSQSNQRKASQSVRATRPDGEATRPHSSVLLLDVSDGGDSRHMAEPEREPGWPGPQNKNGKKTCF
ncbi:unnamed protein product [Rangifer tarandus platyrhynchus]|uniref:Uncharacterized protein n=1 Tax=Rangifer tarandus platyrhynchus TaxID=3082113 RepID=A0ABN8YSH3_RANTA|nr:unnamed protein product [Rangifer tarandus platyrhynchus]